MPCSGTEDISMLTSSSNVGEPGVWIFQVDGTDIILPCPNEGRLHNSGKQNSHFFLKKNNVYIVNTLSCHGNRCIEKFMTQRENRKYP